MTTKNIIRTKKQKLEEEVLQESQEAETFHDKHIENLETGVEDLHYELMKRKYEGYKENPSRANYEAGVGVVKSFASRIYKIFEGIAFVPSSFVRADQNSEEMFKGLNEEEKNVMAGLQIGLRVPGVLAAIWTGVYSVVNSENMNQGKYWLYSLPLITNMFSLGYEIGKYNFLKHREKIIESYNPDKTQVEK
jgi:hypothetical protein